MNVQGIDNVLFAVGDLDTAVDFYTRIIGLSIRFRVAEAGIVLFAIGNEGPGLLLRRSATMQPGAADERRPRLWLEVPDARAASGELEENGAQPLAPPFKTGTGWTVEVADPWGNVVGFADYAFRPELGRRR